MASWPERAGAWVLVPIVAVYLALVVPATLSQGINWDEQVDLTIASSYLDGGEGLIVGSDVDKSQTRLPMYSVALLSMVAGSLSLTLARLVSICVSALTVIGVYVFCRRRLDPAKAVVAAAIVATSPYFLAFAGLAFTEGDAFVTCATVWTLIAGSNLMQKRTVGAAALAGCALGLAVSSKFLGVALIPAVLLAVFVSGTHSNSNITSDAGKRRAIANVVSATAPIGLLQPSTGPLTRVIADLRSFLGNDWIRYLLTLALSAVMLSWIWLHRRRVVSDILASGIVVTASVLTFFVVPPVHTTNSHIVRDLLAKSSGAGITVAQVAEFAAFHAFVLVLKPGILIGLGLAAGVVAALVHFRSRPELRLPVLMAVFYFGFVSLTPVAQTFYMMPVFPLLAILMADWLVETGRRSRPLLVAILLAVVSTIGWDLAASYPDFALNGYQWTGERYLAGRATLGYRGIAQIRANGVEDLLMWAQDNVAEGDTVAGFISERHIVRALAPDPAYVYIDAFEASFERTCPELACADWVFTEINSHILQRYDGSQPDASIYRYRFDRALLESQFEKVLSIVSAYDIEVAQVWRRRTPRGPVGLPS
jgi:hypothetical protein